MRFPTSFVRNTQASVDLLFASVVQPRWIRFPWFYDFYGSFSELGVVMNIDIDRVASEQQANTLWIHLSTGKNAMDEYYTLDQPEECKTRL